MFGSISFPKKFKTTLIVSKLLGSWKWERAHGESFIYIASETLIIRININNVNRIYIF